MFAFILFSLTTWTSSENLWSFMRQPTNGFEYATEVSKEHTFGSPDHTNGTRRIVDEDLASVETLFEAFHERVFFSSEGLSNDWDVAEFGPRALEDDDLKYVSFTNGGDRLSFRYGPAERYMPGTRRFVETNLPSAYPAMLKDLLENDQPILSRGGTWRSSERMGRIRWACSAFQFSDPPVAFGWSVGGWPKGHSMLRCLVPFNAHYADTSSLGWPVEDRTSSQSLAYDLMYGVIQRPQDEAAAFESYSDYRYMTTNGTSVTEEMANLYGNQTNSVYRGFTRRLVPDDYILGMDLEVETNLVEVTAVLTNEDKSAIGEWQPWFGVQPYYDGTFLDYAYTLEKTGIRPARRIEVPVVSWSSRPPYDLGSMLVTLDESSVPDPADLDAVNCHAGYIIGVFSYTASNRVVVSGKWEQLYAPPLEGVKLTVTTNSVTMGVSYLASTARILAAHDRTIELPVYEEVELPFRGGMCASNRIDQWSVKAEHPMKGSGSKRFGITVRPGGRMFDINQPIDLSELEYLDGTPAYTNSFMHEAVFYDYDTAWFSGTRDDDYARVSIRLDYDISSQEAPAPYADRRLSVLDFNPVPDLPEYGTMAFAKIRSRYDDETDTFVFGLDFDDPRFATVCPTRADSGFRYDTVKDVSYLIGRGGINVYRSYQTHMSEQPAPSSMFWRKRFPAYAPGLLGSSRVKTVCDVFASSVVFDNANTLYDSAMLPPFSYSDIIYNYFDHSPSVDYRIDVSGKNAWDPLVTFPADYASHRIANVEPHVRSIIPKDPKTAIPATLNYIELNDIPEEDRRLEEGMIYGEAYPPDGTPVCLAFIPEGDELKCYDIYFYEDDYHSIEIPFAVSFHFDAKAYGSAKLVPKLNSKAATGRTSSAIVTDWDWNALKLKHEDRD